MKRESLRASVLLALVLIAIFSPAVFGFKTLLTASWDAPSVTPSGAFSNVPIPSRIGRTPDPGAPAWQSEPWTKIISGEYWQEHRLPLWNPYSAYGTPLAAAMQPQPFYPLTAALSLHPTPWTYNFYLLARLFVAGLLTYFFARLYLPHIPSLCAGVTFMLTGYFILYLNMPHLSVEILIPGLFLTFELILRRNAWHMVPFGSSAVFLSIVAGMPESTMLSISFATVYALFRVASDRDLAPARWARLLKLFAAITVGFALSAFLLLPFLEFMRVAHDTHQASNLGGSRSGLAVDGDLRSLILYLLPLSFGPVGNSIFSQLSGWTGMRAYWGIVPSLLGLAAIVFSLAGVSRTARGMRPLTAFFAVCLALMTLKRFGSPIINWIGTLPIAEMVVFVKYDEPLMAFCVAVLAGIGCMLVLERRDQPRLFMACAAVLALVTLGLAGWSLPRVLGLGKLSLVFYLNVLAGLALFVCTVAAAWHSRLRPQLGIGIVALVVAELAFNFIVPCFYVFNTLPSTKRDPYQGAPYTAFLNTHDTDYSRVFGREGNLYPNWSGAFKLADVRTLDGMFYKPYMAFIRSFLLKSGDEARLSGDLADRFTGSSDGYAYDFRSDREQRFLTLSSIKYLITTSAYGYSPHDLDQIVAQHAAEKLWGFGRDAFTVGGGKNVGGLFQHPPSRRVSYKTSIDPNRPIFEGVAAIKAAAQNQTSGVKFLLEIKVRDTIKPLFETFLNPRSVAADRDGRPFRIDLSEYAGQNVELLFSTDVGPSGNNAFGWAGWAGIQFVSAEPAGTSPAGLRSVYDGEVTIYERGDVLPRACVFHSAEVLPRNDILARLKAPDFNVRTTLALTRESLTEQDATALGAFGRSSPPCTPARITHYDPEQVTIAADSETPGVLMLNDSNYPGWTVSVNGKPAPIIDADYLFRGVALPAGRNTVVFAYEPQSFAIGVWISLGTLGVVVVIGGVSAIRRRSRSAAA